MRVVLQRVRKARLTIQEKEHAKLSKGLVLLVGIEEEDTIEDVNWLANKILNMRIFADEKGLMNLSLLDINGELLSVSQFTLHASTKKGNRPSFIKSAKAEFAEKMYDKFNETLKQICPTVKTGVFGADMQIELINDGPVTILLDSKNKE